ncbi:unnamed protein product [Arctogadus glacialis]
MLTNNFWMECVLLHYPSSPLPSLSSFTISPPLSSLHTSLSLRPSFTLVVPPSHGLVVDDVDEWCAHLVVDWLEIPDATAARLEGMRLPPLGFREDSRHPKTWHRRLDNSKPFI